ncbi:uncharacterized protein LOC141849341 [Brevipalpus obovatus]|uniref:uncharacterized protein LOC141849341 n=1 Tax=Brevipalpus obovatus TaxID=246614 RepID=UPI003D9EE091
MDRTYLPTSLVEHDRKASIHQSYHSSSKCPCTSGHVISDTSFYVGTARSIIWRSISMGISFLCLMLLAVKLYDVDREIDLLVSVSSEWIPSDTNSTGFRRNSSAHNNVENFRHEMNAIIGELWSSRATLLLTLVFVSVYILTWTWMSYTVREDKATEEVSVKTVLLLTVFAVVDIAASTGFILVRVVMYILRNRHFLKGMRSPVLKEEHDQLTALISFRLTTLKSCSGTTDVFVSLIVALLAILRLYSVACACSFYSRNRKRSSVSYEKYPSSTMDSMAHRASHDSCNFLHRIPRLS